MLKGRVRTVFESVDLTLLAVLSWQSAKTPRWRKLAPSSGAVFEPYTIHMCFQSRLDVDMTRIHMCCTAHLQVSRTDLRTGHRADTLQSESALNDHTLGGRTQRG